MDQALKTQVLSLLGGSRTLTIATVRPDGWPQTTTVGYGADGLDIYFLCGKDSQKAANLTRDDRVSIAIDNDEPQVMRIKGLSMAARARRVTDEAEGAKALKLLFDRYPPQEGIDFPLPSPADVAIFRLRPTVISVLDYSLGFGHTDLIQCEPEPHPAAASAEGHGAAYYFAKTLSLPFDQAVARTREALSAEGFGVITEIDVEKTLKAKIGVDFRPYLILGACNPALAYEALKLEAKVGTMLPCNVVLQAVDGGVEVAAVDPSASMAAIDNPRLAEKATLVGAKLKAVLERL